MFRHTGKSRTFAHNMKLASLLSFVAGIVNVTGVFAAQVLTTNITGHFAYLANNVVKKDFTDAWFYLLFIAAFLAGATTSGLFIASMQKRGRQAIYVLPVILEIVLLLLIAFTEYTNWPGKKWIACILLFAMGLQNALVTSISNAVVRTTHLTGLFTDLGIDMAHCFFPGKKSTEELRASIQLRLAIILFFFLGCIIGGYAYFLFGALDLLLAIACLLYGLSGDYLYYRFLVYRKRYRRIR